MMNNKRDIARLERALQEMVPDMAQALGIDLPLGPVVCKVFLGDSPFDSETGKWRRRRARETVLGFKDWERIFSLGWTEEQFVALSLLHEVQNEPTFWPDLAEGEAIYLRLFASINAKLMYHEMEYRLCIVGGRGRSWKETTVHLRKIRS